MTFTAGEAAAVLGIGNYPPDWDKIEIQGCAVDNRVVKPGNLFVCIKGAHVDGHDFASLAEKNGASAILAEKPCPGVNLPVIVVPNTVTALGKLANHWRRKTRAKVIGVTGTAGKTTLKNILAALLSQKGSVCASLKNNNNQIGMPLSMLNASSDARFWIMEAGISHAGDMEELGSILEPDLAIIINVGEGHNEGLGEKGVAWHKARLLNYTRSNGKALINADYPELVAEAAKYKLPQVFFSTRKAADYRLTRGDWQERNYTLQHGEGEIAFRLPFVGEHFREIGGMAAACGLLCGLNVAEINQGFQAATLPEHRFNSLKKSNWLILDDVYNANPLSMRRMLETARQLALKKAIPFYAVLGAMHELGEKAEAAHEELGVLLAKLRPAAIFWKGDHFEDVKRGFEEAGGGSLLASLSDESSWLEEFTPAQLEAGGAIIFKGSRSNYLEKSLRCFMETIEAGQ